LIEKKKKNEKNSNAEIMRITEVGRKLMETIRERQLKFFGHVMRNNGLEKVRKSKKPKEEY